MVYHAPSVRVSSPWLTGRQPHVSTPTRAVSTPNVPAVRIAPSESVPHGARAVSTPVFKLAPIGRHSGPARPASKPAGAGSRTLPPKALRPTFHTSSAAGRHHHPPGPCPAKRPPSHIRNRPGPIPTQARASATGVSSTGPQILTATDVFKYVLWLIGHTDCPYLAGVARCISRSWLLWPRPTTPGLL